MNPLASDVLYMALPAGRDRAQSLGQLAERLGWSRRKVEQAVLELRRRGLPVASSEAGVWVGDREDMEATARALRGRLVEQYKTLVAVRRTARAMRGVQTTLWSDAA